MRKQFFYITFFLLVSVVANAQSSSYWRKYKHEIFGGVGTTNLMGDLGGSDIVGSKTPVRDFDFKASRFVIHGGYFYRFHERWSVGASVAFGRLYGGDKYTNEPNRSERNINFHTTIIEFSPMIYFSIITEKYSHAFKVGQRGKVSIRPNLYLFAGISGFWFNPKAQYKGDIAEFYDNWYALQPLGTEGQGIIESRDPYSRIAVAIPVGLGISFPLNRRLSLGLEYGFRYTFSDYIDDVSTSYVSKDIFDDPVAAWFSAPPNANGEVWNGSTPGSQRGNTKNNDVYMFLSVTVKYKLPSKRLYSPKF
ncbi:outer membrane beta-barrel protein [Bacteroidales bacterium OttesenSCG-928-I21]|nr:outer membrane beta-barrel protein [Bacteroidales bacterium OttesenSCG-928-I21]